MIKDGKYAAWFRTPHGQGTGIVHLAEGRISGSDSFFTYGGSYRVERDRFTAVLTTRRHADGPSTVFGLDEVEVNLSGVCTGVMATCSGTAKQAPGVPFEATLIYSREETAQTDTTGAIVNLKADRPIRNLPKGLDGRSRPRAPFAPGPSKRPAS
ncbi:hypothetical protein [Bradyrhizobium sp.]|uniref:hypothetical protein n=1 Tax=Bradyrhizobium sp. TaxID=376 RepID=UPI00238A256D|nr:hypothetical protein [Bradyrhizobium sp.]MDE2378856.1 hypothetical protein [Bradyrhizobium sp.]